MEPVVNVIIILGACGIFVLTVICCVSHRKKEPLSQPRDLEKGLAGIKDGGLVVLTGTAVVGAAVTTARSGGCGGGGDGGGCEGDAGGGDGAGGDGGGCGGCGGCGG
ncbi:predicted protein [Arabidopsis lyrata subsp. lyrata]|uniref:Predicted protein n=1 Tax=Arabidopsis lyrata subsp. lyrata TaxID=81972 RepID=D7KL94_ARALL|nr:uncharacterized protein LOC9330512 [Arabidopsis lyrata subsp. lyrata]EFH70710.1 predicted protein [Arabidopsis lyrata subsp. lyrata]|eukprot:XP_002894451.1 uncharacterized protein LOC9330512 [Arabidopsis lyrata subsp. lyrata]